MATSTLTDITLIPDSAVNSDNDGGAKIAYILKNGHLKKQRIKVLGNNGREVAVSGIKAGEQVVVSAFLGWAKLADGLKATAVSELPKQPDPSPSSQGLYAPSH
jgi:multidrug efflux pump subunit AcrA (membrane-fusion protein)